MRKTPRETSPGPALLPLVKESEHPCHACAKCCLYTAIEIDSPAAMTDYDNVIWYLYHENVTIFVDWEGQWYVKFDSRCENLTSEGLCGIYATRPAICKDFDWKECENHMTPDEGPADKLAFETAPEFLAWFEKQRPKAFRRYRDYMERKHGRGEKPELMRVRSRRA
ncbi:MAG: YkgJ family cysteine cluster protein [Myxococcota bacterium]